MRAQERTGKEKREKRPPQSSRNSPGIHDKTRKRRACRSPLTLLSFATSRQTKRQGGRAHKRRPICACLPSALSFLPFPLLSEKKQQREETKRGEERRRIWRRGRNPLLPLSLPSYRSSLLHFILSFSLFFSPSPCPSLSLSTSHSSPSCVFSLIRRQGRKTGKGTLPLPPPRRRHFLCVRVQKLKSRKQERRK